MNASELRIGNLVYQFGVPPAIEVIRLTKDKTLIDATPITITEEWLLKFGFEKDDVFDKFIKYLPIYDFCMDKLSFRVNEGFICYESIKYTTLLKHIQYVHQLQNLYWCLTNQELEYKP